MKYFKFFILVTFLALGMLACKPSQKGGEAIDLESIEEFSWKMAEGTTIRVLLNQHPYQKLIEENLATFEEKTGITVEVSVVPEENYFDKVTTSLNSRAGDPDVFMIGAYQVWDYAPADYMEPLEGYISNPKLTSADYNFDDFFGGIVGALQWSRVHGEPTGTGSQWALPIGFETYCLAYNSKFFKENGLEPPKTMSELIALGKQLQEFNGTGSYGVALRGSRNWATIHPGYMTTFANYGAKDIVIENGKLVSKVNSPEAVAMTEEWVKLIKEAGSPTWSSYTWYQAATDLGAGKAAMLFDATSAPYFQNVPGASQLSGDIAFAPVPLPDGKSDYNANLWVWALAMNASSKNKLAAWLFIQYFTSVEYLGAVNAVDSPRKSVFDSDEYQSVIGGVKGYPEMFSTMIDGTTLQFTPHPYFSQLTTEWAATLQKLVAGEYKSTQEGMDDLKKKMDEVLSDIEL